MSIFECLGRSMLSNRLFVSQEDPYKIVSLAREVRGNPVVTADFLVMDNKCIFLSTDMHGVIRIFEYDPMRKYPLHPLTFASDEG